MHIAISGTYSTGKTTTTEALSLLTGIPRTQARTMREILPEAVPGKTLEQCNHSDLLQIIVWRLTERCINEAQCGEDYFSDGACLHEWVYALSRLKVGINPNLGPVNQMLSRIKTFRSHKIFRDTIYGYGNIVKKHAKNSYDEFIHLPVEFPLVTDGHRPVSERFRKISDETLLLTLDELKIKYHIVSGTIEERLQKIVDIYNFDCVISIKEAARLAREKVDKINNELQQERSKNSYSNRPKWVNNVFKKIERI